MIKTITLMAALLIFQSASAETISDELHSVIPGDGINPHIIRLMNGRAIYLQENKSIDSSHYIHLPQGSLIKAVINQQGIVKSINYQERQQNRTAEEVETENQKTTATVLKNYEDARTIFERLNTDYQRVSQCTNRAHVWSYEEFKNHGVVMDKVFIFFTSSYLWKHKFAWWFHVAPAVKLADGEDLVLDYRYAFAPYRMKQWTDLFVYTKRSCPVIGKYSEYRNHQDKEDCYIMKTKMYYWQPLDMEKEERGAPPKTDFNLEEISWAYQEAF
jgi:hypothetical protein